VYFDRRRQQSFSMYAWMTDFEGNVFWVTSDTVWGRVHSNGALHVNGQPVFMGKATTSKAFDPRIGKGTNNAIFKNGYEQGVPTIDFPTDLSQIVDASKEPTGRQYPFDVYVQLDKGSSADGDGKAIVRTTSWTGAIIDTIRINDPSSFNGALYSSGTVHVKGVLDGKLTMCSQANVYVDDDVLYEQPPSPTSNDVLGLVSENNVYVADNAANNSNCQIDGCIFTRTGSLIAENYNTRPVSGTLQIRGSIVQEQRGAVGTFAGSTITHGFSKRYYYDDRLSDPNFRPPYYPGFYQKTYSINNWWESFRVPDINPD
jgi:hypothetical protein